MATGSETTSTTSASSTAKAPTGEILKFVEAFNKDFDSEIVGLRNDIEKAKLVLASASQIPIPKSGTFPRNDNSVRTIGDLYKYTYNLETGESLVPKIKYQPVPDGATPIPIDDSVEDYRGFEKDTSATKSTRFEIEQGIRAKKQYDEKNRLKNPQGLNPSLWSPGLYYFESVWLEMNYYMTKVKDYSRFNSDAQFSWPYQRDLNDGKETFSFSISTYTPDGDIDYKNNKFYNKEGYNDDDGLAGYSRFYGLLLEASYKWDLGNIASIGIQDLWGDGYLGRTNSTPFPSLRTQYHTGKLEDLKTNPKFQFTRGEASDDKVYFYGNKEFISLYKAILQAGDNYQPVTFDINKPADAPPPAVSASPSTPVSTTTQPTGTTGSSQSVPKFIFNVEDEKTFFCKDPAIEFHIIPSTNDVSQPLVVYREETTSDEDVLDEEFLEVDLSESNGENYISAEEKAENEKYAKENQVKDNTKPPEKITKVEPPVTGSQSEITTTSTTKKPKKDTKEPVPTGGYTVDKFPSSSIDKYSDYSKVPYYAQFDSRWSNNLYGRVTLEDGSLFFWENNSFITTFNKGRGDEVEGVITKSGTKEYEGKKFRVRLDAGGWPNGERGLSSIGDAGCGITSLTMVINYWATKRKSIGLFTTPIKMASLALTEGARPGKYINEFTPDFKKALEANSKDKDGKVKPYPWVLQGCSGTSMDSMVKGVKREFGLTLTELCENGKKDDQNIQKATLAIDKELKEGNPVIWLISSKYDTKKGEKPTTGGKSATGQIKMPGGHFMVIVAKTMFDGKLRYIVNDPGSNPNSRTLYIDSISDLFGEKHYSRFWSVNPTKPELFV